MSATQVLLPPKVPKFVLIKKVVDSKLFPPNADARGWNIVSLLEAHLMSTSRGWNKFNSVSTSSDVQISTSERSAVISKNHISDIRLCNK